MLKYLDQPSFAWRRFALLKAAFGKLLNGGPAAKLFCTVSQHWNRFSEDSKEKIWFYLMDFALCEEAHTGVLVVLAGSPLINIIS